MKILIEVDITPSAHNPNVELDAELVTLRYKRRVLNADVTLVRLDYADRNTGKPVMFVATIKGFQAVEPVDA